MVSKIDRENETPNICGQFKRNIFDNREIQVRWWCVNNGK